MANPQPILNLKDLFTKLSEMKDSELDEPSDDMSDESMDWYEEFAIDAYQDITQTSQADARAKKQLLLNSVTDFFDPRKRAGMMYTFSYLPETDLNYWDMFPVVIRMLDQADDPNSFLGINFHYLEPKYRRILLMNLMSKMTGNIDNPESRILGLNSTRMKIPAHKYGRVCIRRYKYDNIRGKILKIPPEYWVKMIYLPTYRFIGAKPNRVWRDSFKKIRKLRQ